MEELSPIKWDAQLSRGRIKRDPYRVYTTGGTGRCTEYGCDITVAAQFACRLPSSVLVGVVVALCARVSSSSITSTAY